MNPRCKGCVFQDDKAVFYNSMKNVFLVVYANLSGYAHKACHIQFYRINHKKLIVFTYNLFNGALNAPRYLKPNNMVIYD